MRSASVLVLILVAILAINAAPAKKTLRIPVRTVYRNSTAKLNRRTTGTIPLRSQDVAFIGKVTVGTPPQTFDTIIDTGSAFLVVADYFCKDCGDPGKIPLYNGGASSTFHDLAFSYDKEYSDGTSASGTMTADDMNFGGVPMRLPFCRAAHVPEHWPDLGVSGVFGLGFKPTSEEPKSYLSIVEEFALNEPTKLDQNIMSFRFVKYNPDNAGEILFGATEPQYIDGDVTVMDVVYRDGRPQWTIPVTGLEIGETFIGGDNAYVDTGSSYIMLSGDVAEALYADTGAKRMDDGMWAVPDPFPQDVSFIIGEGTFTIPKGDIALKNFPKYGDLYRGAIQSGELEGSWVLGIHFIKEFYVIFDFTDGKENIRFAKRKDYTS